MPDAPSTRLHALDNLRAIMMWLGIVLHVAVLHLARERTVLPWLDRERTLLADFLVTFIHAFRMPVFFILAGFFVVMLAETRGVDGMLKNRLQRLALPFAAFWPFIWLALGLSGLAYLNLMVHGRWGLDDSIVPPGVPRGPVTMHMWFLWQLLWMCLATALAMRLPRRWVRAPAALLQALARSPWGFAVLAVPLVAAGLPYPHGILMVSGAFVPPWQEWLYHGTFFAFGLAMYPHRHELFGLYQRHRWRYAAAGLVFYLATGASRAGPAWITGFVYGCASWLWSLALVGFALRVMQHRQPLLGYLADSAYWVYLVHLPLVILFGAVLYDVQVHAVAKMLLNIAATTLVCLASYELLVRHTWVSVLLNGKRHPRRGAPPAAATAAAE